MRMIGKRRPDCWSCARANSLGLNPKAFPGGVPFDERGRPFSGTSCASQATGSSELIPCIRPQIREAALAGHPCPNTAGHLLPTLLLMVLLKSPPPALLKYSKIVVLAC